MLILCLRKAVDLGSPVTVDRRLPISAIKSPALGPHGPIVSMATGLNWYILQRDEYFERFLFSAHSLGAPARDAAELIWEAATVLTQVKSQTEHWPCDQGIMVAPSGRFPSSRDSPVGSKWDGTPAAPRARWIILFIAECRASLPLDLRQSRP